MRNYESEFSASIYRHEKLIEFGFSTLEKYLFFQRHLRRSLKPVPDEVLSAYEQLKPEISTVYGLNYLDNIYLYHGSGRYHYQSKESHKYDTQNNDEVSDVLKSVLMKGLQPEPDVWVPTPASLPTVSLTHQRFYARWYSDKFNFDDLLWKYGNSIDWASMFTVKNLSLITDIPYIALLFNAHKKHGLLASVHNWAADSKNDITTKTSFVDALQTRSTIPNNFGIIYVMDDNDVGTYEFPLLHKTEKRTLESIPSDVFISMEVPLKFVQETQNLLSNLDIKHIQVFPIECVDLHMSFFPLEQLMNVDETKKIQKPKIKNSDFSQLDFSPITQAELRMVTSQTDTHQFSPQELLNFLAESPVLNALLSQKSNWEGYSLFYHTLSGLSLFERYFNFESALPENIDRDFFRLFYALHDIGDSLGTSSVNKLAFNQAICVEFLSHMGFSYDNIAVAKALLSDDPIGIYLKKTGIIVELLSHVSNNLESKVLNFLQSQFNTLASNTVTRISHMAEIAGMSYTDFLKLLTVFHMIDAGAYTSRGGTLGTLNYVFRFDDVNKTMSYSKNIQTLMESLEQ